MQEEGIPACGRRPGVQYGQAELSRASFWWRADVDVEPPSTALKGFELRCYVPLEESVLKVRGQGMFEVEVKKARKYARAM